MRWIRPALFILLASAALALPASLKRLTHSFHIARLFVDLPEQTVWQADGRARPDEIRRILSQDFAYLGRGSQAFVFASADRRYVLKLFLFDAQKPVVRRFFHRPDRRTREKIEETAVRVLQASRIAYQMAADETGLVYVHLQPTHLQLPWVRLHGPAWRRSTIEMDAYRFVIQRMALPFDRVLLEARLANDRERFCRAIDGFLSLLSKRIALGICNTDPTLFDNFGWMDDRAVEIDFGKYVLRESGQSQIQPYMDQLLEWTLKNAPEWHEDAVRNR